jgi:hypothetical protein
VNFDILGAIRETELIAKGHRLRAQAYLRKIYGKVAKTEGIRDYLF